MDKQTTWKKTLSDFDKSGETVIGFCKKRRISVPSFYAWRNKFAKNGTVKTPVAKTTFDGVTPSGRINELTTQLSDAHSQIIRLKMTVADLVVKNDVAGLDL